MQLCVPNQNWLWSERMVTVWHQKNHSLYIFTLSILVQVYALQEFNELFSQIWLYQWVHISSTHLPWHRLETQHLLPWWSCCQSCTLLDTCSPQSLGFGIFQGSSWSHSQEWLVLSSLWNCKMKESFEALTDWWINHVFIKQFLCHELEAVPSNKARQPEFVPWKWHLKKAIKQVMITRKNPQENQFLVNPPNPWWLLQLKSDKF